MPGPWWILRQYCTINTRTKDVMRRRSCDMLAVPVLIVKPATVTARSTALTTVLCPHQARKRSMRWESHRVEPYSHPPKIGHSVFSFPSTPSPTKVQIVPSDTYLFLLLLVDRTLKKKIISGMLPLYWLLWILNPTLSWQFRLCQPHVQSTPTL